jgi:ubiquinol-cytochrome c reductase cytochrome b subunit
MPSFRKYHPLAKIANSVLIDLPSPPNITTLWNFGSLLGITLVIQFIRGLLLSTRYIGGRESFSSVISIYQDVSFGWALRLFHSTAASFFFAFMYVHIARGLYYSSFTKLPVWNLGVVIYILLIATAFLGYVLPWGQMSYWAATVITNLLSAIPYLGIYIVEWVWGGFAVSLPTLTRFYTLHYLLPFLVLALVGLHIFYLHDKGSTNPLGLDSSSSKVVFHYYYSRKDILGVLWYFFFLFIVSFSLGYSLIDRENFIFANPLVTPSHIQPEWYFLFAYAILRSIPNKLGGVLCLLLSITVLFLPNFIKPAFSSSGCAFSWSKRFLFWRFCVIFILLTWLGIIPAELPYTSVRLLLTILYFLNSLIFFII